MNLDSLGLQQLQRRATLAFELDGCRSAPDAIGRSPQGLAAGGAELQRIVAKHHQRAARFRGKRNEADLDGVGHR